MENTWDKVIKKIEEKQLTSASWLSDRNTLLDLIEKIQVLGVDPSPLQDVSYSNLRTIIPPLRKATKKRDTERINSLFDMASKLSNADLRLAIQTTTPEIIDVIRTVKDEKTIYTFSVDRDQLERLKKSAKLFFDFKE